VRVIPLSGTEAYGLAATDDSVWATLYGSGVLSRVDPPTNAEADAIDAGTGAASLMTVGDEVWMVREGGDASITIFRGGAPVADVTAGELCCDLTSLGTTVWALDPGGALVGIDAATHRVVDRVPVPLHRNVHVNAVGAGDSVWVSTDDTALMRVDPDSGVITARIATGGGVPFVEHDGLLWGAKTDQLWAVDSGTGRIVRRVPLHDSEEVLSMAVDDRSIWLGMRHIGRVGAVERLALNSGRVRSDLPVDVPARIVLAFGSAWVTDSGSGNLYRFDSDLVGAA
jgi:streptogramin lyase